MNQDQGPRWTLLMKKTGAVKSRANVPFRKVQHYSKGVNCAVNGKFSPGKFKMC